MSQKDALDERRCEPRKSLRKRAQVRVGNVPPMEAITTDISLNGLGLFLPKPLPSGLLCVISFQTLKGNAVGTVMVKGRVARCTLNGMDGYRTGIQITQIHPESVPMMQALLQ